MASRHSYVDFTQNLITLFHSSMHTKHIAFTPHRTMAIDPKQLDVHENI